MLNQRNPRRPKRGRYNPRPEKLALLKASGNPINGLGETTPRRPSPFFWHPPEQHLYGGLQEVAHQSMRSGWKVNISRSIALFFDKSGAIGPAAEAN